MGRTGGGALDIPPNTVQLTETYFPLRQAARIESFQPHMHLRGKAMTHGGHAAQRAAASCSATSPSSASIGTPPTSMPTTRRRCCPKGTIIKVKAWHDNTAANKANPDPNVWVGYGGRTVDEMAHAWVNVTYLHRRGVRRRGAGAAGAARRSDAANAAVDGDAHAVSTVPPRRA